MNINKYKNMVFFDAEGGVGGGGGGEGASLTPGGDSGVGELSRGATAFEPTVKQTTGDRPLPGEKPTKKEPAGSGPSGAGTGEGDGGEGEAPKAPAAFDPSKFAKEFGASLTESLKPVLESRQEPTTKMTPEEARKMLKVWEPDDAWYAKYDNLETRKDAIAQMRDALIEQADTLAQFRMQEQFNKFREEIMPGLTRVQETENQQREFRLHTTYPALAKPEIQPLVTAIANDLVARKQTFKTETELFKALADGVEAVMKVSNPEYKLETATTNGNGNQQPADRGGRQLPVTTPGGGGGTGRREGGGKPEPKKGLAIFSKQ